jgi:uncharacterized protein UPF0158
MHCLKLSCMSAVAKLSDLIDTLLFQSEERLSWFDRQTGRIVMVECFVMSALEEGNEEELTDLPDWQKEEVQIAREVFEDSGGGRFIDAPDPFDFHEYRQMEEFIGPLEDESVADQLFRAIKEKGAFWYFKDTLHRLGIEKRWYEFRDNAMKDFVIGWAKDNGVAYVDDTSRKGDEGL